MCTFRRLPGWIIAAGCLLPASTSWALQDTSAQLDQFLRVGQLTESEQFFSKAAKSADAAPEVHAALGLTRFLQAIEYLGQSGYRYGLISHHARNLPLARIPVPMNPNPEKLAFGQLREIISEFQIKLQSSEQALAEVDTESLKLKFFIGKVKLDLDGNGTLAPQETLWRIFSQLNRGLDSDIDEGFRDQAEAFFVAIDGADVHWLRGYCHFLMSICDVFLAYDERELFERCGQILFPNIESQWQVPATKDARNRSIYEVELILDSVAAFHLIHFELVAPDRMRSAHQHLLEMIRQSRESWKRSLAEVDDDHEWIPNPDQTGVLNTPVRREMIEGWHRILDEMESILEGRKLLPFLRDIELGFIFQPEELPDRGRGVNLHRFFNEPDDFDLILAIQGSGLINYLDEGEISTPETWDQMTRVFRGEFFGFAIWFN